MYGSPRRSGDEARDEHIKNPEEKFAENLKLIEMYDWIDPETTFNDAGVIITQGPLYKELMREIAHDVTAQAIARTHRIGQKMKVNVYNILINDYNLPIVHGDEPEPEPEPELERVCKDLGNEVRFANLHDIADMIDPEEVDGSESVFNQIIKKIILANKDIQFGDILYVGTGSDRAEYGFAIALDDGNVYHGGTLPKYRLFDIYGEYERTPDGEEWKPHQYKVYNRRDVEQALINMNHALKKKPSPDSGISVSDSPTWHNLAPLTNGKFLWLTNNYTKKDLDKAVDEQLVLIHRKINRKAYYSYRIRKIKYSQIYSHLEDEFKVQLFFGREPNEKDDYIKIGIWDVSPGELLVEDLNPLQILDKKQRLTFTKMSENHLSGDIIEYIMRRKPEPTMHATMALVFSK